MQKIGLLFVTVGFLGGALVGSLDKEAIDWTYFVPCLVVGVIGVAMAQIAARRAATQADTLATNIRDIDESIVAIAQHAAELDAAKSEETVYDLPDEIDRRFPELIVQFTDAREALGHVHGMQAYADIMGEFAAGERYLNRVWSAAAEGYVDEVSEYLGRARQQFETTRDRIQALGAAK